MAQTTLVLNTLKSCLKERQLTYVDVAKALALSHASVKRIFSEKNISLQRLDIICQLLGMELTDLMQLADKQRAVIDELTLEQEQQFLKQPKLLFIAYMLLNDFSFDEIIHHYHIDFHEGVQLLAHLDRIKFIDLLPGNRIKLRASRNFKWRSNGPIERLFHQQIRKEFFQSNFTSTLSSMKFSGAMLSRANMLMMHQKIEKLMLEFNQLAKQDAKLPFSERIGGSLVCAIRPWEFSLFAKYRKHNE